MSKVSDWSVDKPRSLWQIITADDMRHFHWMLGLLAANSLLADASMLPVIERAGKAHVSAARLEREAGIAIKRLPGQEELVACSGERCALIKDFIPEDTDLLVRVESLAKALDARARFDEGRRNVRFEFSPDRTLRTGTTAQVGQLAPELRLKKLNGSTVALSDFRGKRLLINSWASW